MDLVIRELQRNDLWNGFLTTLDSLRKSSNIKKEDAERIFEKIDKNQDHIIVVAEVNGQIIGSTTLFIESKFIHDGGLVGHIEDVVVDKKYQGKGIGGKILLHILDFAKKRGCYKTILDCNDDVKSFYEKIGFKQSANSLRFDHV